MKKPISIDMHKTLKDSALIVGYLHSISSKLPIVYVSFFVLNILNQLLKKIVFIRNSSIK